MPENIPEDAPPVVEDNDAKRTLLLILLLYILNKNKLLVKRNKDKKLYCVMIFRKSDGTLVDIKKKDYKNDSMFYSKLMSVKIQKEKKQQNVHAAFIAKESSKDVFYSKQAIDKLLSEFS